MAWWGYLAGRRHEILTALSTVAMIGIGAVSWRLESEMRLRTQAFEQRMEELSRLQRLLDVDWLQKVEQRIRRDQTSLVREVAERLKEEPSAPDSSRPRP